jgi:hypothetical protein
MIVIFDLDDTLALTEHRQHFLEQQPKNWKAFNNACIDDKPNIPIIQIYQALYISVWHKVYIFTGRSEDVKPQTIEWLIKYQIIRPWESRTDRLYMRKSKDFRDDRIVKKEMFEKLKNDPAQLELINKNEIIVFEYRQKVVDMWRDMGLTCCQVAPGNF